MKIGYARISTGDQNFSLQTDALAEVGCEKIYREVASGARTDRPVLDALLNDLRSGDVLVVWKLDLPFTHKSYNGNIDFIST
jgi:DNA invertase Pin-like site-specific DNA recombinase